MSLENVLRYVELGGVALQDIPVTDLDVHALSCAVCSSDGMKLCKTGEVLLKRFHHSLVLEAQRL